MMISPEYGARRACVPFTTTEAAEESAASCQDLGDIEEAIRRFSLQADLAPAIRALPIKLLCSLLPPNRIGGIR